MSTKSTRLKASEVRDVMRLVGEVRELGRDPMAWRCHAGLRLADLTGATVAMSIQARYSTAGPIIMVMADVGWQSAAHQKAFYSWLQSGEFQTDPYMAAMKYYGNSTFFSERRQLIDDRDWYPIETVSDTRRMAGVDDCLISSIVLPDGSVDQMSLKRPWAGTYFTRHESVLLSIFHRELQCIWVASARRQSPINQLPDYLRRTFEKLMDGASEKEAAMQLGVTRSTLHSYVKQLHLRLGIKKRSELIARFAAYDFAPRQGSPGN